MTSSAASQRIDFCTTSDGVRIGYAVSGSGPPLVKTAHWMSHLEYDWDSPVWRPWLELLSRHRTLVRFDPRGCGLSDRDVDEVSMDGWASDLDAVLGAVGLARYELLGMSQGGPVAVAHAARHGDRIERLLLYGSYVRGREQRGLPRSEKTATRAMRELIRSGWGRSNPAFRQLFTSLFLPGGSDEQIRWFNELQRTSTTPDMAARIVEACDDLDVTAEARALRVPTLVLHASGDARVPASEGRLLASLIPGSRFVELPSDNHVLLESEPAWTAFVEEVATFLELPKPEPLRRIAIDGALPALTARERDVLELLAEGLTNKAIARRLGLSPKTIRNYVSLVLAKLGASTRTEAVAIALGGPHAGPHGATSRGDAPSS